MAKKKGGTGRVAKAVGAAAGLFAEAAPPREFNKGDLVLAKVKGWPAWPAQVGHLETQGKHVGKYYVTYFGPGQQIGWCTPTELFDFDADQKEASIQKSSKKTADKKFISAIKQICAVQDKREGITHETSSDEYGDSTEDDASGDSGTDGEEDDAAEEGDAISDVKEEEDDAYLTQVVTLNQQDDSFPFHDGHLEGDVEDEDTEKPEQCGRDLQTGRNSDGRGQKHAASADGVSGEGLISFTEDQEVDSEATARKKLAFKNSLQKFNETAEKDLGLKREIPGTEVRLLTYQYERKKNRNKNNNTNELPVASSTGTIVGQKVVQVSAPLHAETSEVQKKVKPKVGRPSRASQQGKMGGMDSKSRLHFTGKSNAEEDLKVGKGNGGRNHEGIGKLAKDHSNDGLIKKGPLPKKGIFSSNVKDGDKKDVKRVLSEAGKFEKESKKSHISSKGFEEGKRRAAASKQRDDYVKSSLNGLEKKVTTSPLSFFGGSKRKGDIRGEGSLKLTKLPDGQGERKEENTFLKGEKGNAWTSPKIDGDEKRIPLSKKPKLFTSENKSSEGKQKHVSIGRSSLDGGNSKKSPPKDGKSRERGTSLTPKADKDRIRKAALDGEAGLPPSKRRIRAFAAMNVCEAEAATSNAAESGKQPENEVLSLQVGTNMTGVASSETVTREGTALYESRATVADSPIKNASVTPDIHESTDGGHKASKEGSARDNFGGQERIESRKHLPVKDPQATCSPVKHSSSEDPRESKRGSKRGPIGKSDTHGLVTKGIASPVPSKSSLDCGTEKRKVHLAGSDSGKLSIATLGGPEAFSTLVKPVFEDSSIKNAVALANEKKNALKREGDSSASMKLLIAAAQAKQRARQCSTGGSGSFGFAEFDKLTNSVMCSPSPSQRRGSSPNEHVQAVVMDLHDRHAAWNSDVDERSGVLPFEPTIDTEATIARDTFVGMLETVSRTKESIGRTTRQAMDCGKHGIAEQIVEIIVRKLENEPSFHRRVDYWFLLDSVTQVAHTQKVVAYLPIVQSSLPRILNAAAPPGGVARENRKQCLKVLNLWLERNVMPELILRHFMTEIESHNDGKGLPGGGHRQLSRYERGVDDPVRDMDGMLVDEYGSNASLNLPDGFSISPHLFEDDDDGSEDGDKKLESQFLSAINGTCSTDVEDASEKFRTVLEDVDGELEMEDVSPTADSELLAIKERERLLADRFSRETRSLPAQPPLPLDPPPSIPSPPPLPLDPPPSPPPPPQSPPPLLTTLQFPYSKVEIAIKQNSTHFQDTSNHQQRNSPSILSAYSVHQDQGNVGLHQGVSKSYPYRASSAMLLDSSLPPLPSQGSSPGFAQGPSIGVCLPPPTLPPACRPQLTRPESLTPPAGDSDSSSRLARPGEEQLRQGLQEFSGGERVGGVLTKPQLDVGPAHSGPCTISGTFEGVKPGDQASAGAQCQYGLPGMQPPMRSRPYGGHISPRGQYQGPAINPSGSQGPIPMLAFRSGGPSHSSWRPA